MIKPFALFVPARQLQTLLTPEALDLLVIDAPAFHAQQCCDFPIAITPILLGQPDHRQAKFVVIYWFSLIAQT